MIDKMLSAIPMYSNVALRSVVRGSPIILLGYSIVAVLSVVRGSSMNFMKIPSQIYKTAFISTAGALVVITV